MTQASVKFLALKAGFEKRSREARADFEEANRIWNATAKNLPPPADNPAGSGDPAYKKCCRPDALTGRMNRKTRGAEL